MKIKVKKQEAVYEERELTFPFYRCQQGAFYYKCISEREVISVKISDARYILGIEKQTYLTEGNIFHVDSWEITEQEWNDKKNEVIELLTKY